ncbi:hypothetical protein B0T20DRAFT_113256 [Sordaria brevicollis]|uniref:C2H2-type domain-containing protein n=1 Tax=Sordaria brevicollis TaxID=83679 RepID=A0AAE0UEY8_SORBR|nr:hypothetical protein B0T20DRAFT_113256 [Sordaria brevicollis]
MVTSTNQDSGGAIQYGGPPIPQATRNVYATEAGFSLPSPDYYIDLPYRPPTNTPDPPLSREASSPSSVPTWRSPASLDDTPNHPVSTANHEANANDNVHPGTNTTAHTSSGVSTKAVTSANHSNRFTCAACNFSSKTQRDFDRHRTTRAHLRKHGQRDSEETVERFYCTVRGCRYTSGRGFTRMDNLRRHERDKHELT